GVGDVHLNLNGHTVSGNIMSGQDCNNPSASRIGIIVTGRNVSNVIIDNGKVTGFLEGIILEEFTQNNHVNGVTVTATCNVGIHMKSSNNNQINGNTVSGNFGDGIELSLGGTDMAMCSGMIVLCFGPKGNKINSNVVDNN